MGVEERYNMEELSKFVRVASVDQCLSSCNHTLDGSWFLKGARKKSLELHFDQNTTDAVSGLNNPKLKIVTKSLVVSS